MDVTGKCRLFRKDFDGRAAYSRSISSKEFVDGQRTDNWINAYESVQMPKGTDLPDKTTIVVTKGFETVYKKRNGEIARRLVVQEYEIENQDLAYENQDMGFEGFNAIQDDSIPF